MNERIKELADEATSYADTLDVADQKIYQKIRDREFAELIVRECMAIAKRTRDNFGSANPDVLEGGRGCAFCVYHNIKNTFGVEE
jgi:hypothetical protein